MAICVTKDGRNMKWKYILAIGLSAAMVMSTVLKEGTIVYANTEMDAISHGGKTFEAAGIQVEDGENPEGADLGDGTVTDSGTISDETSGTKIVWTVYDTGKLVIEGTGITPDWSPWFENKENITDVIIGDGITALGERNFINYPELKTVTIQGNLHLQDAVKSQH